MADKWKNFSLTLGLYLTLILLFFIPFNSLYSRVVNNYVITVWSVSEGLPQNAILAITQSRDGYIWLATELGLVRFNGFHFKVFNRWNTKEIKNNRILCLFEDKSKKFWLGTDGGGFSCFKNGQWQNFKSIPGLASNHIRVITEDSNNNLWLGTFNGLHRFRRDKFSVFTSQDGLSDNSITTIISDSENRLWVGTENGLNLEKKNFPGTDKSFIPICQVMITALLESNSGVIWIGTQKGLKQIKNKTNLTLSAVEKFENITISALHEDNRGQIWIGTFGDGLYQQKDGRFYHFSSRNGLSDDFISTVTEDHEGNIWIGTYTGGLVRLKPSIVTILTKANGLPENTVTAVLQDQQGHLWVGTKHSGLAKLEDEELKKLYTPANGLNHPRINTLHESRDSSIWIGTDRGINRLKKENISSYSVNNGLLSTRILVIYQDSSGIVWIGGTKGLNSFINDTIKTISEFNNFSIRSIVEDHSGILWIGSNKGLSSINGNNINHLFLNEQKLKVNILSMIASASRPGVIWIGTDGEGLIKYQKNKIVRYTEDNGLLSNYIFSIKETSHLEVNPPVLSAKENNYLWMSSYKGLFRVLIEELEQSSGQKTGSITSISYDESEGMVSREGIKFAQPGVWSTKKSRLLFPTSRGLAIIDMKQLPVNRQIPPVVIEEVFIDNQSFIDKDGLKIPSGKHMFEFYFTALSFQAPEKIKFKYKLEGFNNDWMELKPGQNRTAIYFNLDSGEYLFRVIACNNDGFWNTEGAKFTIRIGRSFIKSFLTIFFILVVILSIIVFIRVFVKQKRKISLSKEKKYSTSALTPDRAADLLQKLKTVMDTEKIYLDPALTLKKLSEKLMFHPNHISQIVNDKFKQSFNDYLNSYRIKEAQIKLLDPQEKAKNILEIAYDVGFYSKSVFNTAFKKFTGLTPSQFRKKNNPKKVDFNQP